MIETGAPSARENPRVELPLPAQASKRQLDALCRALDLIVAVPALIVLLPLLALIAVIVRLDSPGPAIFRQQRLGRNLQPFTVMKFRTMRHNASPETHRRFVEALISGEAPVQRPGGPRFKLADDTRVTRIGHLLRRTSLDELPQLCNVLLGQMSIVGPRPPIPYEVERYQASWMDRFAVRPGLTGLWQVSGRCELTHEQMIALDLEYVERRSLRLNLWIILRTVPAVLSGRGAS